MTDIDEACIRWTVYRRLKIEALRALGLPLSHITSHTPGDLDVLAVKEWANLPLEYRQFDLRIIKEEKKARGL